MKMSKQRLEKVFKYDLDLTPEEAAYLKQIGLEKIQQDEQALIEYAVIRLLEDQIKYLSDKEDPDGTGD